MLRAETIRLAVVAVWVGFTSQALGRPPPEQETAEIQATYTKVFDADSWSFKSASLSPDGRWIAFSEGDEATNLWVVSVEGGEPIRLTDGPYQDWYPVWFPSSDRLAFISSRPPVGAIMTIPLDPLTVRPAGPPRQVTLDELSAYFDVSPDGKQIAYTTPGKKGGHALKILPSNGGKARAIVDPAARGPVWGPDGRHIYYVMGESRSMRTALMRVTVDSGQVETVFTWPRLMVLLGRPNRKILFRTPLKGPRWEVAGLDGHSLGRLTLPEGMRPCSVSREGDRILAVRKDWAAPLTVLPVGGGPMRRLNESHSRDRPIGWSADGKMVLFETELNGGNALFFAPLAGGPMSEVKLTDPRTRLFKPILSGDGNHILYAIRYGGDTLSTLKVFSIEEDWSWELSRRHTFRLIEALTGAGGTFGRDGDDFLFVESQEGGYELRRSPPRGPSRLLRTFRGKVPGSIAVHGNRIAYAQSSGDVSSLFLALAGESTARVVPRRVGMLYEAVWSPDGTRIAALRYDPERIYPEGRDLVVFDVTASNEFKGPVRAFTVPPGHIWTPRWLPDGSGIVAAGNDANIWLIPLEPSARPVNLTRDEPNNVWGFKLSPDGRHIAYQSDITRGSSIWLLDLEEPLTNDDK